MRPRRLLVALAAASLLTTAFATMPAAAADPAGKAKMVMQVSDGEAARWNLALNNMENVQADLGAANVELELVAYGPGIKMLTLDSPVGSRLTELVKSGVKVVACENTMTKQKLSRADMLPAVSYAKAGVVELIEKQRQGYAYIRP
jgi:intracellular sulfur oxidation DsrE/DsrF family protein